MVIFFGLGTRLLMEMWLKPTVMEALGHSTPYVGIYNCALSSPRPEVLGQCFSSTQRIQIRWEKTLVYVTIFIIMFISHTHSQMELITQQAMRAGFTGGVVIDYPNSTRAKK